MKVCFTPEDAVKRATLASRRPARRARPRPDPREGAGHDPRGSRGGGRDGAPTRPARPWTGRRSSPCPGPTHPYVSRGGVKLAAALDAFALDPAGSVCLDVGASTGGFTDCLLQRGAARVYAVDVGHGQLDARLRADPRVIVRERVNARRLSEVDVPEPVDLAAVDVSFISLRLVAPASSRA